MERDKEREKRHHRQVGSEEGGERLDRALARLFAELSRAEARRQLSAGTIWINGKVCRIMSRRLRVGDRVTWIQRSKQTGDQETRDEGKAREEAPAPEQQEIDWSALGGEPAFLYRDNVLAVLNKAAGIVVEPTPKEDLRTCLRQVEAAQRAAGVHPGSLFVAAAHRLDAGASGAVAFALRKSAARHLGEQFASRSAKRVYQALVVGRLAEDQGELRDHMARTGPGLRRGVVAPNAKKARLAITHYQVLQRFADATLVQVRLETGRTHQIRVHLAHIGHPLIGDWLYCDDAHASRCPKAPRMFLHAESLELRHPKTDEVMRFDAPLPPAWNTYITSLPQTND